MSNVIDIDIKRISFDDIRNIKKEADAIHDSYMNLSGYYKNNNGQWKGCRKLRKGEYEGHANGAFAVIALIEKLMKDKGIS